MSSPASPDEFDLCSLEELQSRGAMAFEFEHPRMGRHEIAVFWDGAQTGALDNYCPHEGAMLSFGAIDPGEIVCPLHGAVFDIKTGECLDRYTWDARSFETEVRDGRVWVKAPGEQRFER